MGNIVIKKKSRIMFMYEIKEHPSIVELFALPPKKHDFLYFYYKWRFDGKVGYWMFTIHKNPENLFENKSKYPFLYELFNKFDDQPRKKKKKNLELLDKCLRLLIRGYITIILRNPKIKPEYILNFRGSRVDDSYTLRWHGKPWELEFSLRWIQSLLSAIEFENKRKIIRLMDYFGRSVVHESTHFFNQGYTDRIFKEGLARLVEYMTGSYVFNHYILELELILAILNGEKYEKDLPLVYPVGLYVFLVIFVERLTHKPEFLLMEVGSPEEFKNKPFEEKFDFLVRFRKIVNRAKMQKEIDGLIKAFQAEITPKFARELYDSFRKAERNLNMQKTLPREYLEEF